MREWFVYFGWEVLQKDSEEANNSSNHYHSPPSISRAVSNSQSSFELALSLFCAFPSFKSPQNIKKKPKHRKDEEKLNL
jgi:hypothetical protein